MTTRKSYFKNASTADEQTDESRRRMGAILLGGIGFAALGGCEPAKEESSSAGAITRSAETASAGPWPYEYVLDPESQSSADAATTALSNIASNLTVTDGYGPPPRVHIPMGTYRINAPVIFRNPVELCGQGTLSLGNGACITINAPRCRSIIRDLRFDDASTQDEPLPLVNIVDGCRCLVSGAMFHGNGPGGAHLRKYGLYCGSPKAFGDPNAGPVATNRLWNSLIENCYFGYCKINLRVGCGSDPTGNIYLNNTVDHASECGMLLVNPSNGGIYGGAIEHNECRTALMIVSGYSCDPTVADSKSSARGFVVEGVYCVFNGDLQRIDESVGIRIADPYFTLDGTDFGEPGLFSDFGDINGRNFASGRSAEQITVQNCYLNSDRQKRALTARGLSGIVVRNNTTQCAAASDGYDFEFGNNTPARLENNRNWAIPGAVDTYCYSSMPAEKRTVWVNNDCGDDMMVLFCGGSSCDPPTTYNVRSGRIKMTGHVCHIAVSISWVHPSKSPNGIAVTLPVRGRNSEVMCAITAFSDVTLADGYTRLVGKYVPSTDAVWIMQTGGSGPDIPLTANQIEAQTNPLLTFEISFLI